MPGRTPGGRKIVRAPNHLGDVVAALPALRADGSDVMVLRSLVPILELAGLSGRVLPLDRGWAGWWDARRRLRAGGYARGALMTPAFSAAWLFRAAGIRNLRGSATDGRSMLLRERVPRSALRGGHRIGQYALLAGLEDHDPPPVRLSLPEDRRECWEKRLAAGGRPLVGFFPGANAPARRWPVDRFGEVARRAEELGGRVVVLGGSGESTVTQQVAARTSSGIDLGGRTDMVDLAVVLSLCDLLVTNDTGPMHLAGIVHTPTLSIWGPSDPVEVRPTGARDHPVTGPPLPCKPCYRNECPRSGRGTLTERAHEECMQTIPTEAVLEVLERLLGGRAA